MKILQLVSDWKWTGPAEPMLVLMKGLRKRGHQVELVCPEAPVGSGRSLWAMASEMGLDPIHSMIPMRRSLASGDTARVVQIRDWLKTDTLDGPYDIVHCWHSRDHVLAARALRLGLFGTRTIDRTRLVRFLSSAEPLRSWPWNRWLFGAGCDGLVCVSEGAEDANRRLRRGGLIAATRGAVDFEGLEVEGRFDREETRRRLGVAKGAKVIGVVARIQRHRRFDLLLQALKQIVSEMPEVVLVLIGRGTHEEEIVRAPVRELGLEKNVIFAGYRVEDYAEVLRALDVFTFLVPGSDGTCRALLQAAAIGLPCVGSRRGAIPEIILDGQTGFLVEETPGSLAAAWRKMFGEDDRRMEMGKAAGYDAAERLHPERFAAWMEHFYGEALK